MLPCLDVSPLEYLSIQKGKLPSLPVLAIEKPFPHFKYKLNGNIFAIEYFCGTRQIARTMTRLFVSRFIKTPIKPILNCLVSESDIKMKVSNIRSMNCGYI